MGEGVGGASTVDWIHVLVVILFERLLKKKRKKEQLKKQVKKKRSTLRVCVCVF